MQEDLLKNFKKNGVVLLKNFFTEHEIDLISKRAKELAHEKFEFLYLINKVKINESFLSKPKFESVKNEMLESCKEKELKIKSIDSFADFIQPIVKKHFLKDYYIEELHGVFCENHTVDVDLFFDEVLSSVFFTDKILNVYRELLQSDKLVYFGESSITYNKPPSLGWHTDDTQNYSRNTSEKTFHIRGSVFYHSEEKNSGGIKFLHGSHYYIPPNRLIKKIIKKIIWKEKFNNSILNTRILFQKNYYAGRKDFMLWDKRVMHSPWAVKLKKFPWLGLHPSIEKYFYHGAFPRFLAEKNSFPRSLSNLDICSQNKSMDAYVNHESNNYWKNKSKLLSQDFISKLGSKNVIFNDYYIKNSQII